MARTTGVATTLLEVDDSSHSTDAELLERVRGGDRAAYGLLYERHEAPARRFARSLVGDPADADDVVAEVFASVLAAIGRGNGPATFFAPYLMNSVRNECYRLFRRRARESSARVEDTAAAGDRRLVEADPFERIDEVVVVRDAFHTLPSDVQDTLWRTVVEDIAPADFAGSRAQCQFRVRPCIEGAPCVEPRLPGPAPHR